MDLRVCELWKTELVQMPVDNVFCYVFTFNIISLSFLYVKTKCLKLLSFAWTLLSWLERS